MSAFHGQMGMFVRALAYILSHGGDGLRQASEDAVLAANYVRVSLGDLMSAPFGDRPCMHEALFDDRWLKDTGLTTLDFAKAMIDEGYHPMTVYFPLVVHGAMLIEPTESESKASLDLFIMTLRDLGDERARRRSRALRRRAGRRAAPAARRDARGASADAALGEAGAGLRGASDGPLGAARACPHTGATQHPTSEGARAMVRSLTRVRAAWAACALVALAAAAEAQQAPVAVVQPAAAAPAASPSASRPAPTGRRLRRQRLRPPPPLRPPCPRPRPTPTAAPCPGDAAALPSATSGDSGSMGETIDLTAHPPPISTARPAATKSTRRSSARSQLCGAKLARPDSSRPDRRSRFSSKPTTLGFKFRAAVPIAATPDGKTQLSDAVKIG